MHKVLVPFDGSEHAMRALGYVIELSGDLNKPLEVHVLNVQASPIDYSLYLAPDMIDGVKAGLTNEGKRVLDDAVALLTAAGVPFQAMSIWQRGRAGRGRSSAARLRRCGDGTRGLGNFGGLLWARWPRELFTKCRCPSPSSSNVCSHCCAGTRVWRSNSMFSGGSSLRRDLYSARVSSRFQIRSMVSSASSGLLMKSRAPSAKARRRVSRVASAVRTMMVDNHWPEYGG